MDQVETDDFLLVTDGSLVTDLVSLYVTDSMVFFVNLTHSWWLNLKKMMLMWNAWAQRAWELLLVTEAEGGWASPCPRPPSPRTRDHSWTPSQSRSLVTCVYTNTQTHNQSNTQIWIENMKIYTKSSPLHWRLGTWTWCCQRQKWKSRNTIQMLIQPLGLHPRITVWHHFRATRFSFALCDGMTRQNYFNKIIFNLSIYESKKAAWSAYRWISNQCRQKSRRGRRRDPDQGTTIVWRGAQ